MLPNCVKLGCGMEAPVDLRILASDLSSHGYLIDSNHQQC